MIYTSHLLEDTQMQEVVRECATGIESIEFSIAENLDRLEEKISSYRERLWRMGWPHLSLHGPFLDLNPMTYDSLILEATKNAMSRSTKQEDVWKQKKLFFIPAIYRMPIC